MVIRIVKSAFGRVSFRSHRKCCHPSRSVKAGREFFCYCYATRLSRMQVVQASQGQSTRNRTKVGPLNMKTDLRLSPYSLTELIEMPSLRVVKIFPSHWKGSALTTGQILFRKKINPPSGGLLQSWCRERDLNPHNPSGSEDFKSSASADSAIPA